MLELEKRLVDRDLVVLDTMVDDDSLPQRDWDSIINIYNQNNKPFPLSPTACAKIVEEIKNGLKPATVFKARGASYKYFLNRYNKDIASLEELCSKSDLTDTEYHLILSLRHDPYFILGQDLERVRAHKFNQLQVDLRDLMCSKPETFLTYMKEFHSEEFEDKEDKQSVELTIQFAPGLLESI